MTDNLFRIKELNWMRGSDDWSASTPFGSYRVYKSEYSGWKWGYNFDEYYDEDEFSCNSLEDGMSEAGENWLSRILDCLDKAE